MTSEPKQVCAGARSGKVVFRFSCKIARPAKNLERPPNSDISTGSDPAPERDQEKVESEFPVNRATSKEARAANESLLGLRARVAFFSKPERPAQPAWGRAFSRLARRVPMRLASAEAAHRPMQPSLCTAVADRKQIAIIPCKARNVSLQFDGILGVGMRR
jgi:hypothetical protein